MAQGKQLLLAYRLSQCSCFPSNSTMASVYLVRYAEEEKNRVCCFCCCVVCLFVCFCCFVCFFIVVVVFLLLVWVFCVCYCCCFGVVVVLLLLFLLLLLLFLGGVVCLFVCFFWSDCVAAAKGLKLFVRRYMLFSW